MQRISYVNINPFNVPPSISRAPRLAAMLLLMIFVSGVAIYQFLRGPYVFADDYLLETAAHNGAITSSILLAFGNGVAGILVAVLLLPTFRKVRERLAWLYLALCIVNFMAISLENYAAHELLGAANAFTATSEPENGLRLLGKAAYAQHEWAHYLYLLLSCLPVFVLYCLLYIGRLVPRLISVFGLVASTLMFVSMLSFFYDFRIYGDEFLLLPMALVQLVLPVWMLVKGFK